MYVKYRYLSITVPEVSIFINTSLYRYFPSLPGSHGVSGREIVAITLGSNVEQYNEEA